MRVFYLILAILLASCGTGPGQADGCPATEAARLNDEAVANEPARSAYLVNADGSI